MICTVKMKSVSFIKPKNSLWKKISRGISMGKNNALINYYKHLHNTMSDSTPAVYASVVLALRQEFGWGHKRINRVLVTSQHIWEEHYNDFEAMSNRCEEEVGIIIKRG